MARTIIGVNDPRKVKKYSAFLASDVPKKSFFGTRLTGVGKESTMPIQRLTDLEKDAGDEVSFDLLMQLTMEPVEGEDYLEGQEERLVFHTDSIKIDQMRSGVNTGGRMTRKRTIHDLRKQARTKQGQYWARLFDEYQFIMLSGQRGTNSNFIWGTSWSGRAGNSIVSPDSSHQFIAGNKTLAAITTSDTMKLTELDKIKAVASMQGGGTEDVTEMVPIPQGGKDRFVCVMSPFQSHDLTTQTGDSAWLAIQKAAAGKEGENSNIFKGALGMYKDIALQEHKNIIQSMNGSGSAVQTHRALLLGAQAGVMMYGQAGGMTFSWKEEEEDRGDKVVITSGTICGFKKTTFNSLDFGIMVLDTAAKSPAAA